ncbi:hypothetical protein Tco_0587524 [Tanacetum coccineum]
MFIELLLYQLTNTPYPIDINTPYRSVECQYAVLSLQNTPYCLEEQMRRLDCIIQYVVLGRRFDTSYPTGGYSVSVIFMDTAYGSSQIRRIENWSNAFSCKVFGVDTPSDELKKTLEQIEPYNSRLSAIDDIRNLIYQRIVHERIIREVFCEAFVGSFGSKASGSEHPEKQREVDGQTVEEIETKIIAKDGTITRVPGKFQDYETFEEEPVEQPRRHDLYGFVDHP